MTSLLAAAEDGNIDAINELTESASHFDVNLANRVSFASRHVTTRHARVSPFPFQHGGRRLIDLLEFNGTFSTVRLYRAFRSYSLRFGK